MGRDQVNENKNTERKCEDLQAEMEALKAEKVCQNYPCSLSG